MRGLSAIKRMLRGEVSAGTAALEALRRVNLRLQRRRERQRLQKLNHQPARLTPEFARLSRAQLLEHFRARSSPKFFPGFVDTTKTAALQKELFPRETDQLLVVAKRIADEHCWSLLGFGEKCFSSSEINWNRDPLSGVDWPLDYHADINLFRGDGSDARVLWELNRLAHLITLGRSYAVSSDENFAAAFLRQLRSWRQQNPVARGANWSCAMEVALRSMNLLAAFALFLPSTLVDEDALAEMLMIFDQHGAHIRRNLEYSHIATSNHYMCDVAGLLWMGIMLPELRAARAWREFGLRELLNEMDKQILADGADSESSTGYHRLKLELLLYSLILCRENGIEIEQKYWQKLSAMADYMRAYLRPDGRAPLIGDSDSGQILPIVKRAGDDHAYLAAIADAALGSHASGMQRAGGARTEELLWILGEQGGRDYESLSAAPPATSQALPDAGIYILRDNDLYLLFNASGCGLNGRGSHGHNNALSIEVSACGTSFIVDPGSYVYTHDLRERHLFRSTAYHSTVQIDGVEQNTTDEKTPFVIGDEAHPRVLKWETNDEFDYLIAEHDGYQRLSQPVTHRRSIRFDRSNRFWLIEDEFTGAGKHQFITRFHFNAGLELSAYNESAMVAQNSQTGARLLVQALDVQRPPNSEEQCTSRDYGEKQRSMTASWAVEAAVPLKLRWLLLPLCAGEHERGRLDSIEELLK
ncbi:MAG TPA: alginate lyase family protein [Pyrinomonadaceae bacterium]|nr:alginate lyase family protein [Pyrinomonadaceae bacterium]